MQEVHRSGNRLTNLRFNALAVIPYEPEHVATVHDGQEVLEEERERGVQPSDRLEVPRVAGEPGDHVARQARDEAGHVVRELFGEAVLPRDPAQPAARSQVFRHRLDHEFCFTGMTRAAS